MGDFLGSNVSGTVVSKKVIFNNNHFDFLPYLLHLRALFKFRY